MARLEKQNTIGTLWYTIDCMIDRLIDWSVPSCIHVSVEIMSTRQTNLHIQWTFNTVISAWSVSSSYLNFCFEEKNERKKWNKFALKTCKTFLGRDYHWQTAFFSGSMFTKGSFDLCARVMSDCRHVFSSTKSSHCLGAVGDRVHTLPQYVSPWTHEHYYRWGIDHISRGKCTLENCRVKTKSYYTLTLLIKSNAWGEKNLSGITNRMERIRLIGFEMIVVWGQKKTRNWSIPL